MAEPGQDWKIAALMFLYLCASFFLELIRLKEDKYYMKIAYKEAEKAYKENEIPIGAVIVCDGKVLSRAHNKRDSSNIVTRHAEIIAIEKACKKLGTWRLEGCELYVTLEPCVMCTGAIMHARIKRVIYGAKEKRWLALSSLLAQSDTNAFNHHLEYTEGILQEECSSLISQYFRNKRKK